MVLSTRRYLALLLCLWCLSGLGMGETEESEGAPMEKTEQAALYSAIQGFVGDSWNGSDLYPDPCGWTPIQGVSCDMFDGLWYVTGLSFGTVQDNSLACSKFPEIRPQLFNLKHLKSLSFFNCFISPNRYLSSISDEQWLELSTSLETLELRSNPGLIGEIPSAITTLTNLQSLVVLENRLTGPLPEDIAKLTGLRRLVLAGNRFTGKIPEVFGLTELLILDLSRNSLSGPLPSSVGGLKSLLKLDMSNNNLEGKLPSELQFLKNLTLLDMRNNMFSGGLTKAIQEMSSLQEMAMSNNLLGGDMMGIKWKKMGNLVILDVSNTGLTGEIPSSIADLKKLRFLGLSNNKLTGKLIPKMETAMPCLNALYINGNNMSGELEFSGTFYQRMGRRFGGWGNPNLCYPDGEISDSDHIPYGVKPCKSNELTLTEPNSQTLTFDKRVDIKSSKVAPLGSSSSVVSLGFFWIALSSSLAFFSIECWSIA
ncbi:PREDICTED: piriformospora indica-insensitive protein 2 [Tarenaya hassleriana]|uniref:piriformospora indica-insensitive protein 2 n=1 Tax=Tarenaya hassleriana TaxID=28532 RepID=UPI00053C5160|nr:PREDICTED: piriformospora indica-insensitive protein 2 [Tarenaya hassleriana]